MEDNNRIIDSLLESATDYFKTSYDLAKLKAIDKVTGAVSSFLTNYLLLVIAVASVLFGSLGLAFWLGEMLGKVYYGFFAVAAFYGLSGVFINFFLHERIKKCISNRFIKQVLK